MNLAIICPGKNPEPWIEALKSYKEDLDIQVYPEITEPEKVEAVLVWQHPKGILSDFPNLKLVSSMGAGVNHILTDPSIPAHLPIVRIVDDRLTWSMTNYVVMGVLNYHRQITRYQKDQKRKVWDMSNPEIPVKVGVMGVGALGYDVLEKLDFMGFEVAGLGFTAKENFKFPYYTKEQLNEFLQEINVVVCLLPLTKDTENILDMEFFKSCQKGTYLINVARGKHLVEEDLINAINEGYISGALLDVYRKEPLPKNHLFWDQEKITITPHIASVTNPKAAVPQILENFSRVKNNHELLNPVDREKGY